MAIVYLVPAPDMDERAIEAIQLSGHKVVRLFLPPLRLEMPIQDFIARLRTQIKDTRPALLGFCYGGILAIELSKLMETSQVIIVSSIKHRREIAPSRKLLGLMFYLTPQWLGTQSGKVITFLIKELLRLNIKVPRIWLKMSQNKAIIRHALTFDGIKSGLNVTHIHGERDKVIPIRKCRGVVPIANGGHYMFVHQRKDVLKAIQTAIDSANAAPDAARIESSP